MNDRVLYNAKKRNNRRAKTRIVKDGRNGKTKKHY